MSVYESGAIASTTLTQSERVVYESLLLETLRHNAVFVPYCLPKTDFSAKQTKQIVFTEVYDAEPYWGPISEGQYYLDGIQLGSRQVTLQVEPYANIFKYTDMSEYFTYWQNGNFAEIVRGKLGQNMVQTLDVLAMNAHLDSPFATYAGGKTRFTMLQTDLYTPDLGELAYIHLQERNVPGLVSVNDGGDPMMVAITSPRVIHDIRIGAGSNWIDILKYQHAEKKMNHEVGAWGGLRYVKSTRLLRRNYGLVSNQSALASATVPQQGGAATVYGVYTTGADVTAPRYVTVAATAGFSVGQYVTIHSATVYDADGSGGKAPKNSDPTQEVRQIVQIDNTNHYLYFDKPLLKAHAAGDLVTKGVDLNYSIVIGGPAVAMGVAEMPTLTFPPKIDDAQMINRIGWRMIGKFQQFRPEWCELIVSGGSVN